MHFSSLLEEVQCRTVSIVLYSARLSARFGNVIGPLKPRGPHAQFICVWASHWLICMYSLVFVYDLLTFMIFTFCLGAFVMCFAATLTKDTSRNVLV